MWSGWTFMKQCTLFSVFALLVVTVFLSSPALADEAKFAEQRNRMVESQILARRVKDIRVLSAIRKVRRHKFVSPRYLRKAYGDHPLPIGEGQTISQPYIVALMSELLNIKEGEKVLEVGTGSGYQAAILAELTDRVYTVEIIKALYERSKKTLLQEGCRKIKLKHSDGYFGWEEYAPFDAIIVTCAPAHIPQPLIRQLKDGGRLVIPVGAPGAYQTLWQVTKRGDKLDMKNITGVSFVPLTRGAK